jgi:hypothetical protein
MRRTLRVSFFSTLFLSIAATTISHAQTDRFTYVITDLSQQGSGWNALRKLDLQTGAYSDVLVDGTNANANVYDAESKKALKLETDARYGNLMHAPFSTGVAAAAYDRKHNRLYYTPMFIDQLRYIDLNTMKVYYVAGESFSKSGNMHNDEAKCITRMVIAPNGTGYAISNDGTTMVQFSTTGKQAKIKQLGTLVDDPANKGVSVHNRCTSFGGDMIADDKGNLYILSARNQVFKVDIETKVATHLGSISGLPGSFTVNGAVVDHEGNLLVSSAVDGSSYFVVNPKNWEASTYKTPVVFRSSDLANGNYLSTSRSSSTTTIETIARVQPQFSHLIQVYPNPVTANKFNLQFNGVPAGEYTVELTDVMGRSIMQQRIITASEDVNQSISLGATKAKGVYLVRVVNREKQKMFEQKIMVQ